MRLTILSCEVLARDLYYCAAISPHVIDIHLVRRGLHDTPDVLRAELQKRIDEAAAPADAHAALPDAICLGYGLCSNSVAGLTARAMPLVIPRAHDCITLYLGSRARYQEEFSAHSGTYYYQLDYMERRDRGGSSVPLGTANEARRQAVYQEYVQKYGKENADYLLEVMGSWAAHYNRAAFIDLGIGDASSVEEVARQEAAGKGWLFEKLAGSLVLIRKLTHGEWDDDFLIVPPGSQVSATYDQAIIGCQPACAS